jgi:hypothetical protein
LFLASNDFAGFFPMPEAKNYRIIGNLPVELEQKEDLQTEDILPLLNKVTGQQINLVQSNWFTIYRLHHRMADQFRMGRSFLIGDAAHIHSPVGGQGMNTGLQDAYNLAWKLAGVVNDQLKETILDTYAAERMPVAKELLNSTDRIFNLIMSPKWYVNLFKKWVLPKILNFVWTSDSTKSSFFRRISQIGINYPNSPLSLHISSATQIKAGDRLPYLKVFDEKKQEETDLQQWCGKPGFTLILLGQLLESDLFAMAKWITQKYPTNLNFFYLPPSPKNMDVFKAFEIKEHHKKALIVRPDMHIGFISDVIDTNVMDNYLKNVVGVL